MNVSGEFTVNAPRNVVFNTLRDAQSFVRFVDGVHELKELDPTHYEAVFETKVAYMKFRFNVTVEVTRIDEVDPRAHHVGERTARLAERCIDDVEAPSRLRLGVGIDGPVGP